MVPPRGIVFTWGWDSGSVPPGLTRVEVDSIPDADATIVRLRHFGLDAEGRAPHRDGWEHYLSRLVLAASARDAGAGP